MKLKTLISKSEARKIVIDQRHKIESDDIHVRTNHIIDRLVASDEFIHAKKIHTYISTRVGEVDTIRLVDHMYGCGKSIIVPKLNKISNKFLRGNFSGWDNMIRNGEGYYEPSVGIDEDLNDIDIFIVPAVAVSLTGQRVGYGGGYYDKLLSKNHSIKIVLAFEFQIFDNIETDVHDIRIDKVITERRVINTRSIINREEELL